MKKIFCILLTLQTLTTLQTVTAQPVTQEWVKLYLESPQSNTQSLDVCIDQNGFIYVGGFTTDPNNKFLALKYNSAGVLQWSGRYEAIGNNLLWPYGMAIDSSGNVYITGEIGPAFGPFDIMTVKFSSASGDTVWTRKYKAPNSWESEPRDICIDKLGNIYVVGGTTGTNSLVVKYSPQGDTLWARLNYFNASFLRACTIDDSCNLYATGYNDAPNPVGSHSLTLKYSSNGFLRWYRSYADSSSTNSCIAVDSLGNCYTGGVIRHSTGGGGNFVIFKYDRVGNLNWLTRYIMPMYWSASPKAILVNKAGTFIVAAGTRNSTTGDFLTIGFNALSGDTLWTGIYNGPGNQTDEINAMIIDRYNNIYVTGRSVGSGTGFDYATIKYSSTGQQQWLIRYNDAGVNGTDVPNGIGMDSGFNVYVTGGSWTGSNNIIATLKYSQLMGVNPISGKVPAQSILYQNYPNPFNASTNIEFDLGITGIVILNIYNLLGQEVCNLVSNTLNVGSYKLMFDGSNISSGIYFYRLILDESTIETKTMVLIK